MSLAYLKGAAGGMEILHVCGSLAWQALEVWPSRAKILKACVVLRVEIVNVCGYLACQALSAHSAETVRV
jgi:hypothetical protein